MAKECGVCGKSLGALAGKIAVIDGHVCTGCWSKAGLEGAMTAVGQMMGKQYTIGQIKEIIAYNEANQPLIESFNPTRTVSLISFNDNTETFIIKKSKKDKVLYHYDQLLDFELLQDGESIVKGGLGRAVAGGLLFGGVGAVVGGVTGGKKTKSVCKSLQIKLTLKNCPKQTEYLKYIVTDMKTNSFLYKTAFQNAQDTMSALQITVDKIENRTADSKSSNQMVSGADEILKYKELLDSGIITEEEFNAKKAQILGL